MILPLIALCAMVQEEHSLDPVIKLLNPVTHQETSFIRQIADPLRIPEKSPKKFGQPPAPWQFIWQTVAFENLIPGSKQWARFYVFSQERKPENDTAISVARMLARLWEYGYTELKADHSPVFGQGVVEVFLCDDGLPGGEQLFDEDSVNAKPPVKVNTIYLYDLPTFKDPVEMAREVAHEYGHASLAPIGGYKEPEDWANGYLGERLYLKHLAEGMVKKELEPADAMGCNLDDLNKWLHTKSEPLITEASQRGPDLVGLKARDAQGMNAYIGLALYVDTLFPETVFRRSQDLMPSNNAEDYPEAISVAANEPQSYTLNIPSYLAGKPIWIPLQGKSRVQGARITKRSHDWAFIVPTGGSIGVTPDHSEG